MEHSAPNIGTWQTARRQRKQNNFCSWEQQRGEQTARPITFFYFFYFLVGGVWGGRWEVGVGVRGGGGGPYYSVIS